MPVRATDPSTLDGLSVAIVVGIGVGLLTAYGQVWLGESTASLANSAGPWSVAAFVVARYVRRPLAAVAVAVVTLVCCELGYVIAIEMRSGTTAASTVVFWLTAGLLAGPPLGVAGAWSARQGVRRSVGFAVICGVLIGEGIYGLVTILDSTDWRYWAVEVAIGFGSVAALLVRASRVIDVLAVIGTTLMTAAIVFSVARIA